MEDLTDKQVKVKESQNRIDGVKYPGRHGIVVKKNPFGLDYKPLYYVDLFATKKAKARRETFFSDELEVVKDSPRS